MHLTIGTLNLRNMPDWINKNLAQGKRAPAICKMIFEENPDLMGLQECSLFMMNFIEKNLKDYTVIKPSRGNKNEAYNPILVKNGLTVKNFGIFSLSKYPKIPYTRSFASFQCRTCSFVSIYLNGYKITFYNTHLDIFPWANKYQLNVIKKEILGNTKNSILVGDFNMPYNKTIKNFENSLNMKDITKDMSSTFRSFKDDKAIDHILISNEFEIGSIHKNDSLYGNVTPSDHLGVFCKVLKR